MTLPANSGNEAPSGRIDAAGMNPTVHWFGDTVTAASTHA